MIKRNKSSIAQFIIHKVGNKFNSTKNKFSEHNIELDESCYDLMQSFLLRPFTSISESYRFNHHSNIELNEIHSYAKQIFEDNSLFNDLSQHIVTHLYEQSSSPQIKTGDVIITLFDNILYGEIFCQGIGIYKVENKAEFFQTYFEENAYDVFVQQGIKTGKVDKGCLILNTADNEGNIVFSVDNNTYDTQYWIKHFLNIKFPDDYNQHTKNYLELCNDFSKEVMKTQFGGHEQNTFIAKAVDYFKENDTVNVENFKEDIFDEDEHINLFEDFKKNYETDNNVVIRNQFDVSELVLKKQKQKLKSDIKLDTNIQIKIDVDAPDAADEYLERGYDEEKKMKFYKVYFNEEG